MEDLGTKPSLNFRWVHLLGLFISQNTGLQIGQNGLLTSWCNSKVKYLFPPQVIKSPKARPEDLSSLACIILETDNISIIFSDL